MKRKYNRTTESIVKNIKRNTRKRFGSEEKIRVILEGLKGEDSVAEICRKYGITPNTYYSWSKSFLEAGKRRLNGDTEREATTDDVSDIKKENDSLKQLVAEISMENRVLKKSLNGLD